MMKYLSKSISKQKLASIYSIKYDPGKMRKVYDASM